MTPARGTALHMHAPASHKPARGVASRSAATPKGSMSKGSAPKGPMPARATASMSAAAPGAVHTPGDPAPEQTTTIVIGSGFSGLAMAAELNRQGIKAIVLDGFCGPMASTPAPTTGGISLDALAERSEIMRLLEHYARRHDIDIRPSSRPTNLLRHHPGAPSGHEWTVQTPTGMLSAHSIVFTRVALSHLRRTLRSLGVATGHEFTTAMHALGLYMVGVGEMVLPTTQEILHQAKRAGQSIASRVEARASLAAIPA